MRKLISVLAIKKLLTLLLLSVFLFQQNAQSQALPAAAPAANFVMNRAIGGVLTRTAIARGFAANDPRIAATLTGASSSLTAVNVVSGVAGVGLGILGAPVWLTIAASLGVLAVGTAIVAGRTSIALNNNLLAVTSPNSVTVPSYNQGAADSAGGYKTAISQGLQVYRSQSCFSTDFCGQFPLVPSGQIPYSIEANGIVLAFYSLQEFTDKYHLVVNAQQSGQVISWAQPPAYELSANGSRRLVGVEQIDYICSDASPYYCGANARPSATLPWKSDVGAGAVSISSSEGPIPYPDLNSAYAGMSTAAKAEPLSDSALAKIVNQAWLQAAAQPGYAGMPYSVTQPVTAIDVAVWRNENPTARPTMADLLAPANNPGSSAVPISPTVTVTAPAPNPTPNPTPQPDPNTNPSTNPSTGISNVNVVNTPRVDLGADPMTPDPTLETTPTSWQILTPLMSLFPELKNFHTPAHNAECPKPTFQIFDTAIVMESHCTIAEQFRPQIISVMLTVWILVSLFIVLSA